MANERPHPLTIQFLEWVSSRPRTYAEALEAWRTHCPRFTIWEDAIANGLVQVQNGYANDSKVSLTAKGREMLDARDPTLTSKERSE